MFLNKKPESQVERIKYKLIKVKEKDSNFSVFASEKFEYELNDVISTKELEDAEKRLGAPFPEAFRTFLTQLGNGGAGPYYGIYSLNAILDGDMYNCTKNPCCIYPHMSKEYWNELVKPIDVEDYDFVEISDEEFDFYHSKLYGGILKFGTQGCEYDMYLVITGEYAGRVVYTNDPTQNYPFFFTYEDNFLDWYERWLDEILLDYDMSWFGNLMGGDEFQLLDLFNKTDDHRTKLDALSGFYKFDKIINSSYENLKEIANKNFETDERITIVIASILSRFDIEMAGDLLRKLLNSNNERYIESATDDICGKKKVKVENFSNEISKLLNSSNETYINCGIRILYKYKESDISQFKDALLNAVYNKKDEKMSGQLLELICQLNLNSYDVFGAWLQSNSKTLINNALISLKDVPYDKSYFETIKNLLLINDMEISEKIIMYLGLIEDERLLVYYKNIWNRISGFSVNRYIRCMESLENTLLKMNYPSDYFEDDGLLVKLLEEFNINLQNEDIIEIVNVSCIGNLEQVFIIYFLKDKSRCIASYDYNGNFIFETKMEDVVVPIYFMYDFTNVYIYGIENTGDIDDEGCRRNECVCTLSLDEGKITNMRCKIHWESTSERERRLMKLTL